MKTRPLIVLLALTVVAASPAHAELFVAGDDQVRLQVKIAEFTRQDARELGVSWILTVNDSLGTRDVSLTDGPGGPAVATLVEELSPADRFQVTGFLTSAELLPSSPFASVEELTPRIVAGNINVRATIHLLGESDPDRVDLKLEPELAELTDRFIGQAAQRRFVPPPVTVTDYETMLDSNPGPTARMIARVLPGSDRIQIVMETPGIKDVLELRVEETGSASPLVQARFPQTGSDASGRFATTVVNVSMSDLLALDNNGINASIQTSDLASIPLFNTLPFVRTLTTTIDRELLFIAGFPKYVESDEIEPEPVFDEDAVRRRQNLLQNNGPGANRKPPM